MAGWLPIRANIPPAPPSTWELLQNAIEIATYLMLESDTDSFTDSFTLSAHQRIRISLKVSTSLPFLSAVCISDLDDYLHPIFVAKAERAVAVSEYTVAQRLLDPRDPFRLGTDYLDASIAYTHYNSPVWAYLDDPTLF